jgi:hypothetical protein
MSAVWIDAGGGRVGLESLAPASRPDLVIRDLTDLLEA